MMGISGQTPISLLIEQMQTLVDGRLAILCDHLSVMFLFDNMTINFSYLPRAPVTDKHREYVVDEELSVEGGTSGC